MPLRSYRPNGRVVYRERLATVRYVGMTLWCDDESEWVGLESWNSTRPLGSTMAK